MKRIFMIIVTLAAGFMLSSCGIIDKIQESVVRLRNMEQREEKSQELCEEIFEYFKDRDTDALTELFCSEVKDSCDLKSEIEQAYEYIGNVESYSDIEAKSNAFFHFVWDTPSNMMTRNMINGVQTDKNSYIFEIVHNLEFHDDDCVGLHQIRIRTSDSKYDTTQCIYVGKVIETIVPQEIPETYGKYDNEDYVGDIRRIYGENVLLALKTKDKEKLEEMFALSVREQQFFDENLDRLFSYIDGEIVSYSRIKDGSGGSEIREGETVDLHEALTIYDVMTDSGKMYEIMLYAYMIDENNPDNAGLHRLTVQEVEVELTNLNHKLIRLGFTIEEQE